MACTLFIIQLYFVANTTQRESVLQMFINDTLKKTFIAITEISMYVQMYVKVTITEEK